MAKPMPSAPPVTTAASTASYALPSDYDRYINDAAWDSTNYWEMRGSLSPEAWQFRQNAIVAVTTFRKTFRVKYDTSNTANRIYIHPTPTAVESLVVEYVSSQWCESSGGTGQTAWTADTDTGVLDETLLELDLSWRFKKALGVEYADDKQEFELEVAGLEQAQAARGQQHGEENGHRYGVADEDHFEDGDAGL